MMDSWFYYVYSLSYSIIPLIIVAGIVYLIVRLRSDRYNVLTAYRAFIGYFYIMIAASIITMAIGVIYFARVAISQAYNGGEIENELTLASVLLGTGLVICILHIHGRNTVRKNGKESVTDIRRIYLFSLLGIFSLAGLIVVPLTIYRIIHYYIWEPNDIYPPWSSGGSPDLSAPSTEMAIAIVIVILWAYFIFRVLREIKQRDISGDKDMNNKPF